MQQMRDRCIRLCHFANEMHALQSCLEADKRNLDVSGYDLWLFPWEDKSLKQYSKYSTTVSRIQPHYLRLVGNYNRSLSGMIKSVACGRSGETPNARSGLLIGRTCIPLSNEADAKEINEVRVYARLSHQLSNQNRSYLSPVVYFTLENSRKNLGAFTIDRQWSYTKYFTDNTGEHFNSLKFHKGELSRPFLNVHGVYDYQGRIAQNDRPVLCKITQLVVEILMQENVEMARVGTGHDESHVWISAGFDSYCLDHIKKRIAEAREKGKLFPDYHDEHSGSFDLFKKDAVSAIVDFGRGATTWEKIIEVSPILIKQGSVLPKYFHVDCSRLTRDKSGKK